MKHHFGLTKQGGQPSCCFDLCVTPFSALVSAIEDDFAHFFDLLIVDGTNAEGDRSKAGEGRRNIANAYGMTFNHEGSTHSHLFAEGKNDDDFYIRDDFAKFRQRYAARVQNFRDAMQCPVVTLVTHKYTESQQAELLQLVQLVQRKYPATQFSILAV
jgi:hypothetical protein